MPNPKIKLDDKVIAGYARDGADTRTIAALLDCDEATIRKRCKRILAISRAQRKIDIIRLQNKAAKGGNPAMLIWLGKMVLKQRDKTFDANRAAKPPLENDPQAKRVAPPRGTTPAGGESGAV